MSNSVNVNTTSNIVTVINGLDTVITVVELGPQGPTGPQGPSGSASGVITGSLLVTASAASNVITFTKGNATTFDITVDTGSAATIDTGSFVTNSQTSSMSVLSASYAPDDYDWNDDGTFLTASRNVILQGSFSASSFLFGSLSDSTDKSKIVTYGDFGRLNYMDSGSILFSDQSSSMTVLSASHAVTASYALSGGSGATFPYTGSAIISGSLTVTGSVSVAGDVQINDGYKYKTFYASELYGDGATFYVNANTPGQETIISVNALDDIQLKAKTIILSGSTTVVIDGPALIPLYTNISDLGHTAAIWNTVYGTTFSGSVFSGSHVGDGSGLTGIASASYSDTAVTASYILNAVTASYVLNAVSASYAPSAGGGSDTDWYQSGSYLTASADIDITGSIYLSGSVVSHSILTLEGSGSANPVFLVKGTSGELFSITDSLTGSLFSVNNEYGLPILEVDSNDETYIGTYNARSLYTTALISSTTSSVTESVFSISTSSYEGAFFDYTVSSASNARAGNITAIWNNGTASFNEVTTADIGVTSNVFLSAEISASQLHLLSKTDTDSWKIKTIVRSI